MNGASYTPFHSQMKRSQAAAKAIYGLSQPESWKNDPDMWLDSQNIEDVMKQYEEAFQDFEFHGPVSY
jgi:ABC-type Zn uptake system ZnuABC Zn-binding protein ZnuA